MPEEQDLSQKTEEPTPRRLEEALKKGQVISSKEVSNFIILVAFTLVVLLLAKILFQYSSKKLAFYVTQPHQMITGDSSIELLALAKKLIFDFFTILAIPLIVIIAAIIFSNFIQHGFIFAPEALTFDWSKISPLKGIKRLFSAKSVMELVKAIIKFAVISISIYLSIKREFIEIEILHSFDLAAIMNEILRLVAKMLMIISIVMFFIAVIDYLFQRHEYLKNLRMSREEIKEEYKQTEGSPEIKSKLKALRQKRSKERMIAEVPTADVVITNPTHYSVALKYNHDSMSAPKVIAKGKDLIALKIREIAVNNFIPIIENPKLARSLFASTKINDFIPYEHYKAVAEIMAYVMRRKKMKF